MAYVPANHPRLAKLKRRADSVATYTQAGKLIAYDLGYPVKREKWLCEQLGSAQNGPEKK